jgi:hypothetical protein
LYVSFLFLELMVYVHTRLQTLQRHVHSINLVS